MAIVALIIIEREMLSATQQGGPQVDEEEKRLDEALHEADERFVEARTISPLGILLKLERAAEVENLVGKLEENPRLFEARIVLGSFVT